ncbi:type II toxin-antitoxin system VapC family toxin [Methylogaea oryzae]|uniref:Ribonuclease VapC n=1 Tax=Methylogaea oryzae TaxID=1295382 RepID=A0A8D4VQ82_9GAMM|nr:PIN domain-containing protein [Methylogaea oryzae]BBL72473.1 ribonuclease VapC [Methylogaea oryzae]
MILVDTSIWIDHFRGSGSVLSALLHTDHVCTHAWVIGELACGNLGNRAEILGLLQALPQLAPATAEEVLFFIERQRLMGRGIGYVDVHLLAAAALHSSRLYTRDKRLHGIAEELGLAYPAVH